MNDEAKFELIEEALLQNIGGGMVVDPKNCWRPCDIGEEEEGKG